MSDNEKTKPWYMTTTLELRGVFGVDPKKGLDSDQVHKAKQVVKKSSRTKKDKTPRIEIAFWGLQVITASLATMVFLLDDSRAVLVFLFTAIIFVLFGLAQQNYVYHGIVVLAKRPKTMVSVRRNGSLQSITAGELVPGDIIILNAGDEIVADARLVEVKQLSINQLHITGEASPVAKNAFTIQKKQTLETQKNMVFAGSTVVSGYGVGIVVDYPKSRDKTGSIPKQRVTKHQEKRRFVVCLVVFTLAMSTILLDVNVFAAVGLGALIALSVSLYMNYWLLYVSWVALFDQALTSGVRFNSFELLQKTTKVDIVLVDITNDISELAAFIHRLQAELKIEVRAVVSKNLVHKLEHELNISGSALTKQVFMNATRSNKLRLLREYQLLVGFDDIALSEAISLLRQTEHRVLWLDDTPKLQPTTLVADVFVPLARNPSADVLNAAAATFTRLPSLKRIALILEEGRAFLKNTAH